MCSFLCFWTRVTCLTTGFCSFFPQMIRGASYKEITGKWKNVEKCMVQLLPRHMYWTHHACMGSNHKFLKDKWPNFHRSVSYPDHVDALVSQVRPFVQCALLQINCSRNICYQTDQTYIEVPKTEVVCCGIRYIIMTSLYFRKIS